MSQTKGSITNVQCYECLFAFVYASDTKIFQDSVNAWHDLLKHLLVHSDKRIYFEKALLPFKNNRMTSSPHA